jgi:hypothetical protein
LIRKIEDASSSFHFGKGEKHAFFVKKAKAKTAVNVLILISNYLIFSKLKSQIWHLKSSIFLINYQFKQKI